MEEPLITIGLSCRGNDIILKGAYSETRRGDCVVFTPQSEDSHCIVKDVDFGIGFHWENRMDFDLPGELIVSDNGEIINRIGVEKYLECVVSSEMSSDCPCEFIKAHAIISRSWALRRIFDQTKTNSETGIQGDEDFIVWEDAESHVGYHVCADDHCQRYQGLAGVKSEVRTAVSGTKGIVLVTDGGEIADARFSKCCGGRTEKFSVCWQDRDYYYLKSFHDPYCNPATLSDEKCAALRSLIFKHYDKDTDYFEWTETVNGAEIRERILSRFGIDIGEIKSLVPLKTGESGRIFKLEVKGNNKSITIGKELTIRRILSGETLKSSCFTIETHDDGTFILHGRGWGHGVGLCQVGGAVMALSGKNFREILEFYYPGAVLKELY